MFFPHIFSNTNQYLNICTISYNWNIFNLMIVQYTINQSTVIHGVWGWHSTELKFLHISFTFLYEESNGMRQNFTCWFFNISFVRLSARSHKQNELHTSNLVCKSAIQLSGHTLLLVQISLDQYEVVEVGKLLHSRASRIWWPALVPLCSSRLLAARFGCLKQSMTKNKKNGDKMF